MRWWVWLFLVSCTPGTASLRITIEFDGQVDALRTRVTSSSGDVIADNSLTGADPISGPRVQVLEVGHASDRMRVRVDGIVDDALVLSGIVTAEARPGTL